MSKLNYFCLPKEIMNKEFSDFSIQTKLLFSIIITEANSAKSVSEVASLINELGPSRINRFYNQIKSQSIESEGA